MHFPKGTADDVWLAEAGRRGWIVLTRDKRIRHRHLEKVALRSAGVQAVVFTGGNVTMKDTASILVNALKHLARLEPGPCIYHLGLSGRPKRMD